MLLKSIVLVALLGIVSVEADLKNKSGYPNGLHDKFDPGLTQNTTPGQHQVKKWNNDLIPTGCKVRFKELGISPQNTEVYNITYANVSFKNTVFISNY